MDGEKLKGLVVMMDKDCTDQKERDTSQCRRECTSREKRWMNSDSLRDVLDACRCSGRTARQAHTEGCRQIMGTDLTGTAKAEAAPRRAQTIGANETDSRGRNSTQGTRRETTGRMMECRRNCCHFGSTAVFVQVNIVAVQSSTCFTVTF